jgi:hypothetical protein
MSLTKQLWLGILVILLLALGGSFMISIESAKSYLEEQLNQKNKDDATSLALSLSIMQKYPATMEILIYSQFDTGHYKHILLADAQHKTLVEKQDPESTSTQAPDWFSNILPLKMELRKSKMDGNPSVRFE